MNFQDIKYFYEVAKTGNLSYAALNLNVTQPTITKQLKLLSKELGHPLYTRTSKGVVLTNAGKVLLNRAEDLLAIEEAIKKELSLLSTSFNGELKIACVDNIIRKDLSKAISIFCERYSDIKLCFKSGDMDYIRYDSMHGISDVTIGYYPPEERQVLQTELKLKLGLLMEKDDVLSKLDHIDYETIKHLPIIAPKKSTVASALNSIDIDYDTLNIILEFDDLMNYIGIIKASEKYVLCLEPPTDLVQLNRYCFKPLTPEVYGVVGLNYDSRKMNRPLELFIALLKELGIINQDSRLK